MDPKLETQTIIIDAVYHYCDLLDVPRPTVEFAVKKYPRHYILPAYLLEDINV